MYYSEEHVVNNGPNGYQVGDTFTLNDYDYRVEYVRPYQRFFGDDFYRRPEDADNIIVVSFSGGTGDTGYQVMHSGDWEIHSPVGSSIVEALALALSRLDQWQEQR